MQLFGDHERFKVDGHFNKRVILSIRCGFTGGVYLVLEGGVVGG